MESRKMVLMNLFAGQQWRHKFILIKTFVKFFHSTQINFHKNNNPLFFVLIISWVNIYFN